MEAAASLHVWVVQVPPALAIKLAECPVSEFIYDKEKKNKRIKEENIHNNGGFMLKFVADGFQQFNK